MKRIILAILFALVGVAVANAQTTTVTGVVADANGNAYFPGTVSAAIVLNTGQPNPAGVPASGSIGPFATTSGGNFSVVVASPFSWIFTICGTPTNIGPRGNATPTQTCFSTMPIAISGASQVITSNLPTIPVLGPGGSGGGISPNSPVPANQAQGPRYNVNNYGATGDAKSSSSVTLVQSSSTLTDTTGAPWLSTDVGKKIFCVYLPSASNAISGQPVTITGFTSASSISISPSAIIGGIGTVTNQRCVWYTKDDTAAFCCGAGSAFAAAHASVSSLPGVQTGATTTPLGTMICSGGYAVSGPILTQFETNTYTLGVSLVANNDCYIYIIPTFAGGGSTLIAYNNASYMTVKGLMVEGNGFNFTTGFPNNIGMVYISNARNFRVEGNHFQDWGASTGPYSAGVAILSIFNPTGLWKVERNHIQGTVNGATSGGIYCVGCAGGTFDTNFSSNTFGGDYIVNSGSRNTGSGALMFLNHNGDECGSNGVGCHQVVNSTVIFKGGYLFGDSGQPALTADTTTEIDTDGANIGAFTSAANICGLQLAGSAKIMSTNTTWRGNGTSAAICGPSTASFNDAGLNSIQNCLNSSCSAVTATDYATHGFSGGIVPKASITHTPNTCYAVTGNLLATAQNLCTFLNDQNYQVVNITAQSGGTTPANSSCATPPVITLSDGTRTATLTMTTGKTQWSSAVDASTVNSVFASGTTLTISIGANTCATPPVNVAVSYVLQSVLNP